jgi:hypothetical protein
MILSGRSPDAIIIINSARTWVRLSSLTAIPVRLERLT